jgi:hypothetical protein
LITAKLLSFGFASSASEAAVHTLVITALFALLYLAAIVLLHGGFAPLLQVWSIFKEMLPQGRSTLAVVVAEGAPFEVPTTVTEPLAADAVMQNISGRNELEPGNLPVDSSSGSQ